MTLVPPFSREPRRTEQVGTVAVHSFTADEVHRDPRTLRSFGDEWRKFRTFSAGDLRTAGGELFDLLEPDRLGPRVRMLDVGCGSGRWTRYLADRVGHVDAIDPSDAILSAALTHADLHKVRWSRAFAEDLPFPADSFDLVLCIGVLHHVQDPQAALRESLRVLRKGGQFHVYMYYAMENRSGAYRALYRTSDLLRRAIFRLPGPVKRLVCDLIAVLVYVPLVALVRVLKAAGWGAWQWLPLAFYHNKRFHLMRNDALDRFGTPVEKRYTQERIRTMLHTAGFTDVRFSATAPFWHAVATAPDPSPRG